MAPRFTVLLPTHNRDDVVGLAIQSVLDQTETDFELLVVGDGCTDSTAEVVSSFADPRIRWLDLPKAPTFGYANRNVAMREATGQLAAFMAHDDLFLPDHLAQMAELFDDSTVGWAYSRPLFVSDDGAIVPFAVDLTMADQFDTFMSDYNSIPASSIVYRRLPDEQFAAWPEDVTTAADWEMWKRMLRPSNGANLAYLPMPTTLHFRADWRTGAAWGPRPLPAWLKASEESWWPKALRVDVGEASPQQAVAHVVGDSEWIERLRAGVERALDALALHEAAQIDELNGALDGERRRNTLLRPASSRLSRAARRLRVRLDSNPVRHSSSFSSSDYLKANPDVAARGIDAADHYYVYGMFEGRPIR